MSALETGANTDILDNIESISRKLTAPAGIALTDQEVQVMEQIRQKHNTLPQLHTLEQFFANSVVT